MKVPEFVQNHLSNGFSPDSKVCLVPVICKFARAPDDYLISFDNDTCSLSELCSSDNFFGRKYFDSIVTFVFYLSDCLMIFFENVR